MQIIDPNGRAIKSDAEKLKEQHLLQRGAAVEQARIMQLLGRMRAHYIGLKTISADKQTRDDAAVMEATLGQLAEQITAQKEVH